VILKIRPNQLTVVLIFVGFLILVTNNVSSQVTAAKNTATLTLDRETVTYLFYVPKAHVLPYLCFEWTVQTDQSCAGQEAILQFSHNGKDWRNLANTIIESSGMTSRSQPVDSSWAIRGRNYLRVMTGRGISNAVTLMVNVGLGYYLIAWVIIVVNVFIALWYVKGKIRVRKPQVLRKLQSHARSCIQGKEKFLFLTFGLTIRVLLAPWTEHRFDSYVSRLWCSLIYGHNLYPFEPCIPPNYPLELRYSYPPIWLFVTLLVFPIWRGITGFKFPESPASLWNHGVVVGNIFESYRSFNPPALPLLNIFLKLPNILADVGIGYLLINLPRDTKYEKAVLFLWILNPYTIQISSIWGAFDPLCTFLTLYSVYLLSKKKFYLSAMFLSLGIATKMYPMFFLIPTLIYVYKEKGLWKSIKYFTISLFIGILVFSSFLLFPGGLEFVYHIFIFKASPDWYGKNLISGLTWTYLLTLLRWEENLPVFPLIFIPLYLTLTSFFWRGKKDFDSLVTCLVSILLLTYLSYTVVNPQYIFWVLPFLLYLVMKGKFTKKLYKLLSAIPLIYMYGRQNPLYFVSPVFIWQEGNCLPWSDVIHQLWPIIFNDLTIRFLSICAFPVISLLSLLLLIKSGAHKEPGSLIHLEDDPLTKERHQQRRSSILSSWKEKLGIETRLDLLIFFVVTGVAVTILITLAFAGLGYIVPIPY